jgi:flavin-dependent dehydrogenase
MDERCDVVIVGSRLAGATAAAHLARAGRRVVVLDRSHFPSNQLSTHLLFPSGVHELQRMGALDGILASDPVKSPWLSLQIQDSELNERWRPSGPIDYCMCVPRTIQDIELVRAARVAGAEVRERHRFLGVLWRGGRACGVRYAGPDGVERTIGAKLVVGADGRRSSVAAAVGSFRPYRSSLNGRGLVFRYGQDPLVGTRAGETIYQFWEGDSLGFLFPSAPRGKALMLFMGAAEEASLAKSDPEGYWAGKMARHPRMAARAEGMTDLTPLAATGATSAYFRASSGPGWVLLGDAGHFKDPVIGQGQRDAMWSGRVLAEEAAPVLEDPAELDRALRKWERERDRECLPSYHFGNIETRVEPVAPVFAELVRRSPSHPTPDLGDLFGRARSMPQVLSLARLTTGLLGAVARPKAERAHGLSMEHTMRDLRVHLGVRRELLSRRFRSHVVVSGSEHANAEPPTYRPGAAASKARPATSDTSSATASDTGSARPARPARNPRPSTNGDSTANQPTDTTPAATRRGTTAEEVPA